MLKNFSKLMMLLVHTLKKQNAKACSSIVIAYDEHKLGLVVVRSCTA